MLALAFPANAQVPKLNSVSASWVRRGATSELVFHGENLARVTGFLFSGEPGMSAEKLSAATTAVTIESSRGGISTGDDENKALHAKVTVAKDAPLGAREVRVVSPAGVSNPVQLNAGYLPEITEHEGNNTTNDAQWVDLPAAINGVIQVADDIDTFRFKAEKGQQLIFDAYANRTGSPLDTSLALLGADGKELARSEDAIGFDSLIDFTVPETGEYYLQLRDFRFQGGGDYKYRIVAGELPYLDGVFPFGGRRGQIVEVSLRGRNLDGADKMSLRVAADAPMGVQEIRAHAPKGFSNAKFFDVSDLPEFIEQEPNDEPGKANSITVPGVANGRLGAARDVDVFKFKVEKDQTFIFEVEASRYGSAADPLLTIMNAKGEVLERNDDAAGTDARIQRGFGEAGEYLVSVRDLLDRGGDAFAYRLSIRPPAPNFSVKYISDDLRIYRGGRLGVRVEISRQAGFGGPVEVNFDKLPPGLSCSPEVIPPELDYTMLMLSASDEVPPGYQNLKVAGSGMINGRMVRRVAQPLVADKAVKEGFLSVLDATPFTLDLETPAGSVEQEQALTLEVQAVRRNGFNGEIKLSAEGYSSGREGIGRNFNVEAPVIKMGESRGRVTLRARVDSETGTRLVWLRGEANVDGRTVVQYSRAIPVSINMVPFTLANNLKVLSLTVLPPGSKSAAGEAELQIKASRRGWFTDLITLTIEGLPEGVNATTVNLPNGVGDATFKLTATDKAAVGKETSFTVLGSANVAGRTFQQRTAPIKLTINAAAADADSGDKKQASTK
ncbi:MAG TPA: PPC domain-containing protein [Verrucomicrobiae bacterium]|nr:PPC domain-containing protein [Verrucomicrobiae bacterium]